MRTVVAVLIAGLFSTTSHAQGFPYPIHSQTLDNGLTVHVVPMPSDGVVAYYTWMAVGSRDEITEGRTGFAHFFEHLMFYGTETLGGEEREKAVFRLGAEENAWTWFDETVYHALLSSENVEQYIEMEADRFQNLSLTEAMVRKEAGAVYGEYRKGQASPSGRLHEQLWATAFETHTYGHDTIGYEADIKAMPTAFEHAQSFFERHYRPQNATILVVGDVKQDEVFSWIGKSYGDWDPLDLEAQELPSEPEQKAARTTHLEWPTPTAPLHVEAWRIPGHDPTNPDHAALQLLSDYLLAPTGPLNTRLVREEGIAYRVGGGRMDLVDDCLFTIDVQLKDESHRQKAQEIIQATLSGLSDVDEAALERTQSHTRYRQLTQLSDPSSVAGALGWALRRNPDPTTFDTWLELYAQVGPEDIQRVAAMWLVPERQTTGTLSSGGAQ